MALLPGGILRNGTDGRLTFWCPGCDGAHQVATGVGPGPRWGWNGSTEKPTFTPSLVIRTYQYPHPYEPDSNPEHREIREQFEQRGSGGHDWMMDHPKWGRRCHSFIADGVIDFLGDCTHELRGKHPIPPWPKPDWSDG